MSLNLDEKVVVKNLCEWEIGFRRLETPGDVVIGSKGITRLPRAEVQAQVFANNTMFVGTDGKGNHAKVYIEDKDTRILVGFEEEESKETQSILTKDKASKLFEYKTISTFKKHVQDEVVTQAEKSVLFEEAKRQKLNDYEKIKFIEEYTGYKFDAVTPK